VQVWHRAGQPWDSHDDIRANHGRLARECDQLIAALIKDLKQHGMLEDTLVIWGGEFGRTPTVELPDLGTNSFKRLRVSLVELVAYLKPSEMFQNGS